jgi:DNA-binding FadR family transcriptional regulator
MIESKRLHVGERLPAETELAGLFGVSRPVLREALVSLRILGLTSSRSGSGTYVESNVIRMPQLYGGISSEQLTEVRRALEVPGARLAAARRNEDDLHELERVVEEFEREADPGRRVRIDSRFHAAVARATQNPLFARLLEDLRRTLEEHSLAVSLEPGRRAEATSEHRELLEAIRGRDVDLAGRLMSAHLEHLEHSVAALLRRSERSASSAADGRRPARSAPRKDG